MKSFVCTVLAAGAIAVKTDLTAGIITQASDYQGWMPRDCVDYTFNGVSDQLSIQPRPVQDNFTLAFWVRTTQAGTGYHQWYEGKGLVDGEVPGFVPDFGVSLMAEGLIGFGTDSYAFGQSKTIKSKKRVNDNEWRHVVATRNSDTGDLGIYIDGVLDSQGKGYRGPLDAPPRLTVGSLQSNINYFQGYICQYKVFDVEVTPQDAKRLYDQEPIQFKPVAYQEKARDDARAAEEKRAATAKKAAKEAQLKDLKNALDKLAQAAEKKNEATTQELKKQVQELLTQALQ